MRECFPPGSSSNRTHERFTKSAVDAHHKRGEFIPPTLPGRSNQVTRVMGTAGNTGLIQSRPQRQTGMETVIMTRQDRVHRDPEDRVIDQHSEQDVREKMLDKTIADTFPASDPPSSIPNPTDDSFEKESDAAA